MRDQSPSFGVSISGASTQLHPRCPTCRAPVDWSANPQRPFCSLTCRLIDLGAWIDERHRITADTVPDDVS